MRLIHKDYQFDFELLENRKCILIIENTKLFSDFIQEILIGEEGEDCNFILSENDVPIKIKDNIECIINPFSLTLNERKILNKLHDILKTEIQSSDLLIENNEIYSEISNYANHIIQNSDWQLMYSDKFDVQNLLKFMDIKFLDDSETLIEKIIQYIEVVHDILGIKCFIFIHLLSYISEYELTKLYEILDYQKICILLIESQQPDDVKYFHQVVIVDKDGCEINLNM